METTNSWSCSSLQKVWTRRCVIIPPLAHTTNGLSRVQDFMGKSDPYLQFARQNSNGSYTVVHKIPVSQSNLAHQDCFTRFS